MTDRRAQSSIMANPVLIGAATLLVTLVGVFLAYNANSGLPFVPTYEVTARVPDAAELVAGNDVRIGGKRVGAVASLRARKDARGAVFSDVVLKLEQTVQPLPIDTRVAVRPRSALGAKYVELTPGRSHRGVPPAGVLPLRNARPIVELDEVLNAFDHGLRRGTQDLVADLSTGVAGRGGDVNEVIGALPPLLGHLQPVMRALRSRRADLRGFIDGVDAAAEAVAPVTPQLGALVDELATTLQAIGIRRDELAQVLDLAAPTERTGAVALRVARPVLRDAAALVRGLRPGAALLPVAARDLARTAEEGTPVLRRATSLGPDLEGTLRALRRVAVDPATRPAVQRLRGVVASLEPTLRALEPFQVTCNYLGLWTRNASSTIAEGDVNGGWFRFIPVYQPTEILQSARPAPQLHATPYGNTDGECEVGNEPYVAGRQVIGSPPGPQPNRTEDTGPPAGVGQG